MMKKHGSLALAASVALGLLVATPSQAQCPGGVCEVACAGGVANDLILLDATMALAVPGDKIVIRGVCSTTGYGAAGTPTSLGGWRVTKAVQIVGDCGSIIRKAGPALPSRQGNAIHIMSGASGASIEGLTIQGNRHAIATGYTVVGALDVLSQADYITIRNNRLIGRAGRGVSQFVGNSFDSPADNPNPCSPALCPPTTAMTTVADHWVIDGNLIETPEIGLVIAGNDNTISNNYIKAAVRGINTQNNHSSPVAVTLGGAAPGNFRNKIFRNVIESAGIATIEFGLDINGGLVCAPNPTRCDRGHDNVWSHNCITNGPAGIGGYSIAYENSTTAHNNYTMSPGGGNESGFEIQSSAGLVVEHNKFSGYDFSIYTFGGDEKNIRVAHNHIGTGQNQAVFGVGTYQLEDFSGLGSGNLWLKNHACELDDPGPSPPSYVNGTLIADDPAVDGGGNLLLPSLCGDPTLLPGNGIPGQPAKFCRPFEFDDPSYCKVKSSRRGSFAPLDLAVASIERPVYVSGGVDPTSSCMASGRGLVGGVKPLPAEN